MSESAVNKFRILAINPGSTSTKIAVFDNVRQVFIKNIKHSIEELAVFPNVASQYEFRKSAILDELSRASIELGSIHCIMGRGGLIKPIESGVYEVNDLLLRDLKDIALGEHASNLGGIIARDLISEIPGARAYIADPVVVDEMHELARISGHPLIDRVSIFHALNQKAVARSHARSQGRNYEELNLIVVHLGGGITVGAHCKGKVIDVNQGLDGDGPFSPERTGSLPVGSLVRLCFSGKYTQSEIRKMITGQGGYVAYLGTNDAYEVEKKAEAGDGQAALIQAALAYQVAKEVGAMSTVLEGNVDAILLTGGMAYGKPLVELILKRIRHLGEVYVYPGEDEMRALAMNGLRILQGEEKPKVYF
jgi:butyrate kinase